MTELTRLVTRWRRDPIAFVRECLRDPETGEPFKLYPAEAEFLRRGFTLTRDGRLPHPELLFSAPKKSGKTALAAMAALYVAVIVGGPYAEVYCLANDFEQSSSRVWEACRRMVAASPFLQGLAKVTASRITFTSTGSFIQACASDYSGFAGANPSLTVFDELWGYVSESARRLFDESAPSPVRRVSARLTVSYAGFVGESDLLEGMYKRVVAGTAVAPDLYVTGQTLGYWTHELRAPWQTPDWLEQMREQSRPNAFERLYQNRWVAAEDVFITPSEWDAVTDPQAVPIFSAPELDCFAAVDASTKHDSTALSCVAWVDGRLRLVNLRVFQPSPDEPLDFESTVEATLIDWKQRYRLREVRFDPWQMASSAQRLRKAGLTVVEFPQTVPNLSAMAGNIYDLVRSRQLSVFPDDRLRRAVAQAVASESARGWVIKKERQSHRIDALISTAMACLAAVQGRSVAQPLRAAAFGSSPWEAIYALWGGRPPREDLPTWDFGFTDRDGKLITTREVHKL